MPKLLNGCQVGFLVHWHHAWAALAELLHAEVLPFAPQAKEHLELSTKLPWNYGKAWQSCGMALQKLGIAKFWIGTFKQFEFTILQYYHMYGTRDTFDTFQTKGWN